MLGKGTLLGEDTYSLQPNDMSWHSCTNIDLDRNA
jgi:hypothetical protein